MRRQLSPIITMVALAAMFFTLTSSALAQPGEGGGRGPGAGKGPGGQMPGSMVEMRVKMLTENLELNKDQAAKIKAILEDEQKAAAADREKNQGDREAALKSRETRRDATDAKVKAVLTKEQVVKYDKMMAEFRNNRPGGPPKAKDVPKIDAKATPDSINQVTNGAGK